VVNSGIVLFVLLKSSTAPWRIPGTPGVKVALTVQVPGAVTVPMHVLPLASKKLRPPAPCMTTWGVPKSVVVETL
jgi:hypothetical protein